MGILGPLEVRDGRGAPVAIAGARLRALLVRLALDAGHPVQAGVLVDAVWGDDPPADAANALQTLVSRLRRALGEPTRIIQSPAGYRLAADPDDVDLRRFEALAADGSRALREGHVSRAADLLTAAVDLWRGPALVDGGPGLAVAANRLEDLRVSALVDRAAAQVELGAADEALPILEALAADHPIDERIARHLVVALARAGRPADALRAYERIRTTLADELGVDPSGELQAVHVAVLRGEMEAPVAPPPTRRTNLKAALTSFVGRDEELARIGKALDENRLVTIVGPGGAGKTRLAEEVGSALDVPDGVWLAELAPVTDGADVAQTVLTALGLREKTMIDRRPTRTAVDAETRLIDVLEDKDVVLVLDNCEHLIDAAARLAELLLGRCPDLRVLATSREPLGLIGEVVLAIPPLGQPNPDADAETALEFPAVRLFADRAAAALPGFGVDNTNVATVIEIVRRLDGLPLAIELAAARLRSLPISDIAARLSDRFRLLTGGSRTALPRHRTLRAVVEWSWDLLTDPERTLVERLAIFPGGLDERSACAVCADSIVPSHEIVDVLDSLLDKSLLQRVGEGRRLRMLETIREYGAERLAAQGTLGAMRGRHADYFQSLLAEAQPHLISSEQLPWFERFTLERENILAALRYRCDVGEADDAIAIAVGLSMPSMMLGNHADIATWTGEALAVPGASPGRMAVIAGALYAVNSAAMGAGQFERGGLQTTLRTVATELAEVDEADDPTVVLLGAVLGYFAESDELAEEFVRRGLASDHDWTRAAIRMFRATIAENNGDIDSMRTDTEIALREFRKLGERWGLASTLRCSAMVLAMDGELAAAEAAYEEALDLMTQMGSREDEAFLLIRLADLAERRGDHERAHTLMRRARVTADDVGSIPETVFALCMEAEVEFQLGRVDRARELLGDARRRTDSMGGGGHPASAHGLTFVNAMSARIALHDGDFVTARAASKSAYDNALTTRDMPIVASVAMGIADIALELGRSEVAAQLMGAGARLRGSDDRTSPDFVRISARLRELLGPDGFDTAYAAGRNLDRADALERIDPESALAR